MISKINLTTGPVGITDDVQQALAALPISHRSAAFQQLYQSTSTKLSSFFKVKKTYLYTGSGTLANEVMLQQVKARKSKGVILSNGEFGERLIRQAARIGLDFIPLRKNWGEKPGAGEVESLLRNSDVRWLLFCHCETSTGVINNLETLARLAKQNSCDCFVDCMSTVGTCPLDLSGVTMASASSGKGLAAIPGIAIVFSNTDPLPGNDIPTYLDLSLYQQSEGVPYTISSNLVRALEVSISQKLNERAIALIKKYKDECYDHLYEEGLVVNSTVDSLVITVDCSARPELVASLLSNGIEVSYNSGYLKERNWCQLAFFGFYEEYQLEYVIAVLPAALKNKAIEKPVQAIGLK